MRRRINTTHTQQHAWLVMVTLKVLLTTAVLILFIGGSGVRVYSAQPHVTGAFVQLTGTNAMAEKPWWQRQLDAMAAIGMDTVIVQYVANNEHYYYPSSIPGVTTNNTDAIQHILEASQKVGIRVYLGLQLDSQYWADRFDLKARLEKNTKTWDEINQRYGSHPALGGWYIPEEISDLTPGKKFADSLLTYMGRVSQRIHAKSNLPVMVSPYFGQNPNPHSYAKWWDQIVLPTIHVDIVALQDGVGTHRTSIGESRPVFEAMAPVMKRHRVAFWANNESFDQTHDWPIDDHPWAAKPVDFKTFLQQVRSTSPFVEKIVTFEFTHYMSPHAPGASQDLYRSYQRYLQNIKTRTPVFSGSNPSEP